MNVTENKLFLQFLGKLHERLTIMLDYNIDLRIDPAEEDIKLLKELHKFYYTADIKWADKEEPVRQEVTQNGLFADTTSDKK